MAPPEASAPVIFWLLSHVKEEHCWFLVALRWWSLLILRLLLCWYLDFLCSLVSFRSFSERASLGSCLLEFSLGHTSVWNIWATSPTVDLQRLIYPIRWRLQYTILTCPEHWCWLVPSILWRQERYLVLVTSQIPHFMNSLKFASFQPLFGMLLASFASLFVDLLCFIEPISVSFDWQSHSPTPLLFASCGWCLLSRCCCRGLCWLKRWVDHPLGCLECLHHQTWTLIAIDLDYKSCILGTPIPSFSAFYEPISVRVSFNWACWIPLIASTLLTGTNCLGHHSPTDFWLANAWLTASVVWRGW